MQIIATIKSAARWAWVILVAAGCLIVGILGYGRRKERLGEARGGIEADRERLREAAESGDDSRVLDEWRRSRRKP
jgi:hypothetical protein